MSKEIALAVITAALPFGAMPANAGVRLNGITSQDYSSAQRALHTRDGKPTIAPTAGGSHR